MGTERIEELVVDLYHAHTALVMAEMDAEEDPASIPLQQGIEQACENLELIEEQLHEAIRENLCEES